MVEQGLSKAFDSAFSALFAAVAAEKSKNEVIELNLSKENLEKAEAECIEKYFNQLHGVFEFTCCAVLSSNTCTDLFFEADKARGWKLSKFKSVGGQRAWASFEGNKLHDLMSLCNRYMKRPVRHSSGKLRILKTLWVRFKPELMSAEMLA